MRLNIRHSTHYVYDSPIRSAAQLLRMTPRDHEGQFVGRWRVETDVDARMRQGEDSLGNITHALYVDGPLSRIRITVEGEVETSDTGGIVRGAVERFEPEVYLRETALTLASPEMRDYLSDLGVCQADPLDQLHHIMAGLNQDLEFMPLATTSETKAEEAFALKKGVCEDFAHIFIALSRRLKLPARYVSGHLFRRDGAIEQEAAHAWAEAHVPGLGWVGFDAANGVCPTESYVRVATGLDYLGAAPVRGSRIGGGHEVMDVTLSVAGQSQTQ